MSQPSPTAAQVAEDFVRRLVGADSWDEAYIGFVAELTRTIAEREAAVRADERERLVEHYRDVERRVKAKERGIVVPWTAMFISFDGPT